MGFLEDLVYNYVDPSVVAALVGVYQTEILIAIGIVILLTTLLFVWLCCGGRSKGRVVCLLGLGDSGKTLLFIRLNGSEYMRTQNSIQENSSQYSTAGQDKPLTLVDVPGNERIRERIFNKYRDTLKAIVLVIDSYNFPQEARSVAELFYDLLSDRTVHKKRVAILVACNKQDLAMASSSEDIRKRLEAEITALKSTRAAKLEAIDGGPKNQAPVSFGKKGKDFEFKDLSLPVSFVECSARGKGEEDSCTGEVEEIETWLGKLL